jgi:hypothetical protein
MFDSTEPLNAEKPSAIPTRPQGSVAVIARLQWADRAEWTPAKAVRWTAEHVMVTYLMDPENVRSESCIWLRASDVRRRLPAA